MYMYITYIFPVTYYPLQSKKGALQGILLNTSTPPNIWKT